MTKFVHTTKKIYDEINFFLMNIFSYTKNIYHLKQILLTMQKTKQKKKKL